VCSYRLERRPGADKVQDDVVRISLHFRWKTILSQNLKRGAWAWATGDADETELLAKIVKSLFLCIHNEGDKTKKICRQKETLPFWAGGGGGNGTFPVVQVYLIQSMLRGTVWCRRLKAGGLTFLDWNALWKDYPEPKTFSRGKLLLPPSLNDWALKFFCLLNLCFRPVFELSGDTPRSWTFCPVFCGLGRGQNITIVKMNGRPKDDTSFWAIFWPVCIAGQTVPSATDMSSVSL
jgi:hypothetical protein